MDKAEHIHLYDQMVTIRKLEEQAALQYQDGKIGGFLHLYIGQEAVSTGIISVRQLIDPVITAYRDHGVAINVGISAREVMAELLGKSTGISGGKGGSMHMADVSKNFWGGHAIVGAHLPIAVGLALADQYNKTSGVTISFFGDGATNIGYFHEAMNLSMVWKLPILWVCENNQYGMGTSVERSSAVSELIRKAKGYGMNGERVDGMDLMAVQAAARKMLAEIRSGGGPQFLETITYRFRGHSMGDPERYRKSAEVHHWQENDPISIYRKYLLGHRMTSEEELNHRNELADEVISKAVAFAEASPEPPADRLFWNVYADNQGGI